jgi:hypothetical protein
MTKVCLAIGFLEGDDTPMKIALDDLSKQSPINVKAYVKLCFAAFQHASETGAISGPPLAFGLECLREACENLIMTTMPYPDAGPSLGTDYNLTNIERQQYERLLHTMADSFLTPSCRAWKGRKSESKWTAQAKIHLCGEGGMFDDCSFRILPCEGIVKMFEEIQREVQNCLIARGNPALYRKTFVLMYMGNDAVTFQGNLRAALTQQVMTATENFSAYIQLIEKKLVIGPAQDDIWGLAGSQQRLKPVFDTLHRHNVLVINGGGVIAGLERKAGDSWHSTASAANVMKINRMTESFASFAVSSNASARRLSTT